MTRKGLSESDLEGEEEREDSRAVTAHDEEEWENCRAAGAHVKKERAPEVAFVVVGIGGRTG